jgi:Recombinase
VSTPIAPTNLIEITTDKLTFFRHFDKDYLHEQYVVLGKPMAQIARERGCVRSTVRAALVGLGFKTQDRKELNCNKGQVPFGFRVVHGNLVPHQGEKAVLGRMADLKNTGATYGEIAKWLNTQGVKTKNGAQKWDRPTIFKMLKNFPTALSNQ